MGCTMICLEKKKYHTENITSQTSHKTTTKIDNNNNKNPVSKKENKKFINEKGEKNENPEFDKDKKTTNSKTEENIDNGQKYPSLDEIENQNKINIPENDNDYTTYTDYDAIYKCESLSELLEKGWNYNLKEKFVNLMKAEKKFCPLCVIGETNKGKTYLINYLTNKKFKSGDEFKTEGLSCKYSFFQYQYNKKNNDTEDKNKFLIFDTAGRSEPLLIEPEEKEKKKNDLRKTVEFKYGDLKESEEFLKNLLIDNSQIILLIVNQLTLSEQILLNELKNQNKVKFEQLYIIHNLFNFETKEDIENYVDNTICRSIYFDITKKYFNIKDKKEDTLDRPFYFTEEQKDEKNNETKSIIAHLILGNLESKNEWVKKMNSKTTYFIKELMQTSKANKFFTIPQILEKQLQNINKIPPKKGKLTDDKINNILKVDEKVENNEIRPYVFSFSGFVPDYIYYKKSETEFVIEVECGGPEDPDFSITASLYKGKVYFTISGKKMFPKELKEIKEYNLKDTPFYLSFPVNCERENIIIDTGKEINEKKADYENGIYKKTFKMSKYEKNLVILGNNSNLIEY